MRSVQAVGRQNIRTYGAEKKMRSVRTVTPELLSCALHPPSHRRHRPDVLLRAAFAPPPPSRLPWSGGCPIGNLSSAVLRVLLLHPESLSFPLSGSREGVREREREGGTDGVCQTSKLRGARKKDCSTAEQAMGTRREHKAMTGERNLLPVGSGPSQRRIWLGGGHASCSTVAAAVPSALAVSWPWW